MFPRDRKEEVAMAFEELSPEQLRALLEAAYAKIAECETRIRECEAEIARRDDENERFQATNDQLLELLRIDPLTRVASRFAIAETVEKESIYAKRRKTALTVLFLDIDRFKAVNDGADLGHEAGDAILRQLGARLKAALRPYDEVGRWGGEEFLVVLRDTTAEQAKSVAERLRKAVADTPFEYNGRPVPVTVSLGVAERQHDELAATLVHRADRTMYRAKRGGRNRVEVSGG